jgi:hypothetical protein
MYPRSVLLPETGNNDASCWWLFDRLSDRGEGPAQLKMEMKTEEYEEDSR